MSMVMMHMRLSSTTQTILTSHCHKWHCAFLRYINSTLKWPKCQKQHITINTKHNLKWIKLDCDYIVLHHCVVIVFWSSGIMFCMMFWIGNRYPLILIQSLPVIIYCLHLDCCLFPPCRLCFLRTYHLLRFIKYEILSCRLTVSL